MKPIAKMFVILLFVVAGAARMAAQDPHASFSKPFPPFKVMDNI